MPLPILFHDEVAEGIANQRPIVALESTLITHGLPYPANVEAARATETAVRQQEAIPATVAIIQGQIHVGLTAEQLEYMGTRSADDVMRCSRRNLPLAVAGGVDGVTTVAGTMIVARQAGIEVFATGGVGGVHRGTPLDVSADLTELGRTAVTVVCSGVKPFLDLAATREVLETQGVTVLGLGTNDIAPFFTQDTGHHVDARLESAAEVAEVIRARRDMDLQMGTLVTIPVPATHRFDYEQVATAMDQAVREAIAMEALSCVGAHALRQDVGAVPIVTCFEICAP